MSARKLAAALAAIALFAFVLPPLAAHQVHVRRIDRARETVERIAKVLEANSGAALADIAGPTGLKPFVLAGSGTAPAFAQGLGWPAERLLPLNTAVQRLSSRLEPSAGTAIDDSPDPWGNQYLVVVTSPGPRQSVSVISAGPNGIVETPFGIAAAPQGDDIVAVR